MSLKMFLLLAAVLGTTLPCQAAPSPGPRHPVSPTQAQTVPVPSRPRPAPVASPPSGWHPPVAYPPATVGSPRRPGPIVTPLVTRPAPVPRPPVVTAPGHPRPPVVTAPGHPRPPVVTAPGHPRPPVVTAPGHPRPPVVTAPGHPRPPVVTAPGHPRPPATYGAVRPQWQPPPAGRPVRVPRLVLPTRLPPVNTAHVHTMRQHAIFPRPGNGIWATSVGQRYWLPPGGWVTGWHRHHPHLNTCVLMPYVVPQPSVVVVSNYWVPSWGAGWAYNPYGFYWNNRFWFSFGWGSLWNYNWSAFPVYFFSPISQYLGGPIVPPATGFSSDEQVYLSVLHMMAMGNVYDAAAGLYQATPDFNPAYPGQKITAEYAFNLLRQGYGVYYHPPGGAFELVNALDDLRAYLYLRESRELAPAQSY